MNFERSSGILLHPTSMPGPYGIGDLGKIAYQFVDFLVEAGQTLWQVMPLCPTGYGDSPYQGFSAFAGNIYLISLDKLVDEGWLTKEDIANPPAFPKEKVDFGPVIQYKMAKLLAAFQNFKAKATPEQKKALAAFQKEHKYWLDDFALFMALKEAHGGKHWNEWHPDIAVAKPSAKKAWRSTQAAAIEAHIFYQFEFFRQWHALRDYANTKNVKIIGDVPIFVAYDSADVWAHPDLFFLDDKGRPTVVAGVPPDYFSETGQLWGNPLYHWEKMEADGFAWWKERMRTTLELFDILRLDHFRGFEAFWEVPAKDTTAVNGKWAKGPDAKLFIALEKEFGKMPIIAEDLGVITSKVVKLRDRFGFPGMKILQFAFGGNPTSLDLPHNFITHNCVVYTGTHDNDTTAGWYKNSSTPIEQDFVRRYVHADGNNIAWDLARLAMMSIADIALIPMQDLIGLGSEARLNFPGKSEGNWAWRLVDGQVSMDLAGRLRDITLIYGRNSLRLEEFLAAQRKAAEAKEAPKTPDAPAPEKAPEPVPPTPAKPAEKPTKKPSQKSAKKASKKA